MIIYSKSSGLADGAIGKLETPIKMIIEHESDLLSKKGGICSALFNVEKSSHFGETVITRSDFDVFQAAPEGAGALFAHDPQKGIGDVALAAAVGADNGCNVPFKTDAGFFGE